MIYAFHLSVDKWEQLNTTWWTIFSDFAATISNSRDLVKYFRSNPRDGSTLTIISGYIELTIISHCCSSKGNSIIFSIQILQNKDTPTIFSNWINTAPIVVNNWMFLFVIYSIIHYIAEWKGLQLVVLTVIAIVDVPFPLNGYPLWKKWF